MNRYDLHCHTRHSDGEKTIFELMTLAKKNNLSGLSITDHDTLEAYDTAFETAQDFSLELVTGVELSCLHNLIPVHLLAYSFSLKNSQFRIFIKKCQDMRSSRNFEMIERFKEIGITIDADELEKTFGQKMHQMGRPHFAKWLIQQGYVQTMQEAFKRYLADNKPCFVLGHRPTVEEAIEHVHAANSFAILAHPHLMTNPKTLKEVLKMDLDGIECYYAKMMPVQEKRWVEIARQKNWMITGGSDYHGDSKPMNPLGSSWVSQETFMILKKQLDDNT